MRTIIFSDVHGEPDIIGAVVGHSSFDSSVDRLIFAGDAIEIGRDSSGCLDLLEKLGAECLVGNHEWGAFTGEPIEGMPLDPALVGRVEEFVASGRWRLATTVDDVLITHAGVGQQLASDLGLSAGDGPENTARALNAEFDRAVAGSFPARGNIVGNSGPLWWRPDGWDAPMAGMCQVVGHTPPEIIDEVGSAARLMEKGVYLVDPFVRGWRQRSFQPPTPIRYAVIEDGVVRLVEGR